MACKPQESWNFAGYLCTPSHWLSSWHDGWSEHRLKEQRAVKWIKWVNREVSDLGAWKRSRRGWLYIRRKYFTEGAYGNQGSTLKSDSGPFLNKVEERVAIWRSCPISKQVVLTHFFDFSEAESKGCHVKPCLKAKFLPVTCLWLLLEQSRLEPFLEVLGMRSGSRECWCSSPKATGTLGTSQFWRFTWPGSSRA